VGHALVVGGGTMGVGIITMFLAAGWRVDVVSRSASTRDALSAACARALASLDKPTDTPALRTFAKLEESIGHAERIGFGEIIDRGTRAVDGLSDELVYAGFSLGVLPAQKLAQTRPGALGALLFYSCVPVSEFGSAWPAGVPVQVHGMDADPIFVGEGDIDAARALVESTDQAELFLYPGDQHYFADGTLPSYDADAAALLLDRTLALLRAVA